MGFAKQGGPGAKFKNPAEKLFKCLGLPKGAKEELGISGDDGMKAPEEFKKEDKSDNEEDVDEEKLAHEARVRETKAKHYELFGEGRYHLAPSFFRLLMYLKK